MKKLFSAVILIISLTSCTTFRNVTFVDYSGYDCFITESNSVSFDYKPIGSVKSIYAGYELPNSFTLTSNSNMTSHDTALKIAIKQAVDETKKKGGDGIINFKYEGIYNGETLKGWVVSGMAIKLIEKKD